MDWLSVGTGAGGCTPPGGCPPGGCGGQGGGCTPPGGSPPADGVDGPTICGQNKKDFN